jgi:acetate kinase
MSSQYVLVINCGSSSLKFALFQSQHMSLLADGLAEALNTPDASLTTQFYNQTVTSDQQKTKHIEKISNADHRQAINAAIEKLDQHFQLKAHLLSVGHRVVHGGEHFSAATKLDSISIASIEECASLAPLHNPANLIGINILSEAFPSTPQVAVFDTAFHQTMPAHAYRYALPSELYKRFKIRRYGFHGTSHEYVARTCSEHIKKPFESSSFVVAHLGNGASVCAINHGKSVDTSMGLTPLEGLVMGTRSGDIDPGIFAFLVRQGYTGEAIDQMLNKESGLLGLSGISNDMRTLDEAAQDGNENAALAIDVFCFRLAKYIAAMLVSLDACDGLIFTGGIGENASRIRALTCTRLSLLGFDLNPESNQHIEGSVHPIHKAGSRPTYVVKTNEELMIAQQAKELA